MNNNSVENITKALPKIEKDHRIVSTGDLGEDQEVSKLSKKGILYVSSRGIQQKDSNFTLKDGDLLITEYPSGTRTSIERKGKMNRIVAAFSKALVIVSSSSDADIHPLLRQYSDLEKNIFCFKGSGADNSGNEKLLKAGIELIEDINDKVLA